MKTFSCFPAFIFIWNIRIIHKPIIFTNMELLSFNKNKKAILSTIVVVELVDLIDQGHVSSKRFLN